MGYVLIYNVHFFQDSETNSVKLKYPRFHNLRAEFSTSLVFLQVAPYDAGQWVTKYASGHARKVEMDAASGCFLVDLVYMQ